MKIGGGNGVRIKAGEDEEKEGEMKQRETQDGSVQRSKQQMG